VFPGLKVYVAGGVGFSRHSLSASVGRETTNAHMRGALWVGGVGVRYDLPARGLFVVAEGAFFFPRSLSVPPYSKTGPISASGVKSWGLKLGCGYKF
jgi:hypothetical protein